MKVNIVVCFSIFVFANSSCKTYQSSVSEEKQEKPFVDDVQDLPETIPTHRTLKEILSEFNQSGNTCGAQYFGLFEEDLKRPDNFSVYKKRFESELSFLSENERKKKGLIFGLNKSTVPQLKEGFSFYRLSPQELDLHRLKAENVSNYEEVGYKEDIKYIMKLVEETRTFYLDLLKEIRTETNAEFVDEFIHRIRNTKVEPDLIEGGTGGFVRPGDYDRADGPAIQSKIRSYTSTHKLALEGQKKIVWPELFLTKELVGRVKMRSALVFTIAHEFSHAMDWIPESLETCLGDRKTSVGFGGLIAGSESSFGAGTDTFNYNLKMTVAAGPEIDPTEFSLMKQETAEARQLKSIRFYSEAEMVADYFATHVTARFIEKSYSPDQREQAARAVLASWIPSTFHPRVADLLNRNGSKPLNELRMLRNVLAQEGFRKFLGDCKHGSVPVMECPLPR